MTYDDLIRAAWEADKAYYVLDKPTITDEEYDNLIRQIEAYEMRHPEEIRSDSPTQRIGGKVSGAFQKVTHPQKMLSLNNAFTLAELQLFHNRVNRVVDDGVTYIVEPKLDGLTLVCFYEGGKLVKAVTRGNGVEGEDVTATARTIRNLPLTVPYTGQFQVRGECVIPVQVFMDLNNKLTAAGEEPFANPRNAAAGSIRQKDPALAAERRLSVCFYDLFNGPSDRIYTEIDKLDWMEENGLPTVREASEAFDSITEAFEFCVACGKAREEMPIEIDGMVLKVNRIFVQEKLGAGNKFPNWAIAYKFPAEHKATTLTAVEWQVGRTGKVTPVAIVESVNMNGIRLTHASLHNPDYIAALGLRIGAKITVYKAAEIIPQVGQMLEPGNGDPVSIATVCPACGEELHKEGADLMCNNAQCLGRLEAWLCYFGSRPNMYINGLGESVVKQLVSQGLCKDPADLYTLTREQLLKLDGFSDKKADSLLESIRDSKSRPYYRVLSALGIDLLGASTAYDLAVKFPTMERLLKATIGELMTVPGIALRTATAVYGSLHKTPMTDLIRRLGEYGLQMELEQSGTPQTLAGLTICITGSLSKERDDYKDEIQAHGGKFVNSVSSKTSYLVVGENVGETKLNKARKLKVPMLSEAQLQEMINGRKSED